MARFTIKQRVIFLSAVLLLIVAGMVLYRVQ